ncbi:uncharacterized protein LOC126821491 [Patella vulgata]|uniref:uncharacterized protein LOC126821491 n=1 Tax=Patella vulgata TaxID=6465 RepID=UPI0024A94142|nr:uncharacterized protein LOC126821491 [Patella vulgata]
MKMDNIGKVAREDPLIVQHGNYWMQKNVGNKLKRGAYISQIMRLCARLLINLREYPISEEPTLWSYLKASHLDNIVKATLKVADAISDDNLQKPSNARKLGFYIKRVINCQIGIAIMTNNETSRKEAEDLLKTMEIFWGTRIAKLSNVLLEEKKYNKNQPLPKPDDIAILNKSIEDTINNLNLNVETFENFTSVVEAISAKLVVYNRRRVGEVEAIRLTDYEKIRKGEAPEHLVGQLTDFEKKLLKEQEVMTVRGKTGRGVPIILPKITKQGLKFLTDRKIRKDGVIRAYNCLAKACSKAPLSSPELITSTTLRKYMATITQVLDLKPNEMTWVLDHLGHSMDVHKIYYRKTQIAKLLLIQDTNQVGRFKDKSLTDVQMEDVVFNRDTETMVNFQASEVIDSDIFDETKMDSDSEEDTRKSQRKRPCITTKAKWSEEEEAEIRELFKKFINKKIRPTPAQCLKAIAISKEKGGVIWRRKKDVLKKKLFRIIDKLNKQ